MGLRYMSRTGCFTELKMRVKRTEMLIGSLRLTY